ncbi:MBL fold metallo-hydrolase [bacterium]|nr:MBL fold metallo-hydrolase [bacterium]
MAIISLLVIILNLSACRTERTTNNDSESARIDSLVEILEINERTAIIRFGYDAVTAIKTSEGIVLIDAGISTFLTGKYKRIIENKYQQKNFRYVINSHGHHDHIRGNSLFPEAQIIGHENIPMELSDYMISHDSLLLRLSNIVNYYDQELRDSLNYGSGWEAVYSQKIRYGGAYDDLKNNVHFRLPDITFPDSMVLESGDATFEMKYFGEFHSNSDILIYVPEIKVLFTGDLFTRYGRPGMKELSLTDEDKWNNALSWINQRTNNITCVIDGHGQVLTTDDLKRFNEIILEKYTEVQSN